MVEIDASLPPQGKSAPENKLSYPADPSTDMYVVDLTEVQLLSFVCSTGRKASKTSLWNVQNLGAVPP